MIDPGYPHDHDGINSPLINKKANGIGNTSSTQNVISVDKAGVVKLANPSTVNFTGSVTVTNVGGGQVDIDIPGSAVSRFPDLLDVPSSYTSQGGLVVVVKSDETGLEFKASEYNNGSVTGTATINWANANTQYVTLTGNTTFTFTGALPGGRYILHVAGAFTPTFPATVRWNGAGSAPAATASSGRKDMYGFIYSAVDSLYTAQQVANYLTS